ncbi:uncharacterized protein BYT42DRAFT_613491 [Radiomyces spectabilis]|uniref:uncharacterized protein n=1 Tax=Radiomyces spectabilis TaxID=64574 RepID=UPI00221F0CE2|nr:uncharacterized protein BYT42DRAFT_613491 [Radiomyces spectabilis]KAI8379164.1 hypothetical protein BYT42DRAFT_613491 [Radiomyces spectabilis]
MQSGAEELPEEIPGILEGMASVLNCPVCDNLFNDAMYANCGDLYCRNCLEYILKANNCTCVVCDAMLDQHHLQPAENIQNIVAEFGRLRSIYSDLKTQVSNSSLSDGDMSQPRTLDRPPSGFFPPSPSYSLLCFSPNFDPPSCASPSCATTLDYDSDATFVTSLQMRNAANEQAELELEQEHSISTDRISISSDDSEDDLIVLSREPRLIDEISPRPTKKRRSDYLIFTARRDAEMMTMLAKLAKFPNVQIAPKFSNQVTHVIVPVDENNRTKRSPIYLMALLLGKFVVNDQYIMVDAEPYEVIGDFGTQNTGIPRKARLHLASGQRRLFENMVVAFWGEFTPPLTRKDLRTLILSGGGQVLASADQLPLEGEIICGPKLPRLQIDEIKQKYSKIPIVAPWILSSIAQYQIQEKSLFHAGQKKYA